MGLRKNPNNMNQKIFIKTFGCQMNEYDSNRIYDSVKKIGYEKTEKYEEANCYLLNTCHIRDKAKEKVYHEIGRVKKIFRSKKKPLVIIAGCVAQAENQEMLKREPYIDLVIGPQAYHKINDTILNYSEKNKKIEKTEFDAISKFKFLSKIKNEAGKVSSFLTIQEGCDKFCHFCVVPYTRGPEYSRPFNQVLDEAKFLADNGAREIILLGQNVNAYDNRGYRLSDLILKIDLNCGDEMFCAKMIDKIHENLLTRISQESGQQIRKEDVTGYENPKENEKINLTQKEFGNSFVFLSNF